MYTRRFSTRQAIHFLRRLTLSVKSLDFFRLPFTVQQKILKRFRKISKRIHLYKQAVTLRTLLNTTTVVLLSAFGNKSEGQSFAPAVNNPYGITTAQQNALIPALVDIDGDGDDDLFLTDYNNSDILFYQNNSSGGTPSFAAPQVNPFGLASTAFAMNTGYNMLLISFPDMDNDGDYDLLLQEPRNAYGENEFVFVPNTGTPQSPVFGTEVVNPFNLLFPANIISSQHAIADLDNDGDLDIIANTYNYGNQSTAIYYFQNTGTAQIASYAAPTQNPFGLSNVDPVSFGLAFTDLDCDSDLDLLATGDYAVDFLENTGTATSPLFTPAQSGSFGLTSNDITWFDNMAVGDPDGDNDIDIIVGAYYSSSLVYFENTGSACAGVGLAEHFKLNAAAYPNPFSDRLTVSLPDLTTMYSVTIYNSTGVLIKKVPDVNGRYFTWDGNDETGNACVAGLYQVVITSGNRSGIVKTVKL